MLRHLQGCSPCLVFPCIHVEGQCASRNDPYGQINLLQMVEALTCLRWAHDQEVNQHDNKTSKQPATSSGWITLVPTNHLQWGAPPHDVIILHEHPLACLAATKTPLSSFRQQWTVTDSQAVNVFMSARRQTEEPSISALQARWPAVQVPSAGL